MISESNEWPAVAATAGELSRPALELLEVLCQNPAECGSIDWKALDVPAWARRYTYELHPWPTLVGSGKLAEIRRAVSGVARLIHQIPERIFDLDFGRISAYYRMGSPLVAAVLLEPPNGIESSLARVDFVDSGDRFGCVELNSSAFLGGWQPRFWDRMYRALPPVARFVEERSLRLHYRDPLEELFRHVILDNVEKGTCTGRTLNLALAISENQELASLAEPVLDEIFRSALEAVGMGLEGRLLFASYPAGLTARTGKLFRGSTPVHAVVEYTSEPTPDAVYRCFKGETATVYNGPLARLFGDKRNLALLHQYRSSDRFDEQERAIIRAHVPWTAEVAPGPLAFRDDEAELSELATVHREDLVLKPARGARGESVYVGRYMAAEVWAARISEALAAPEPWIVQEYLGSRPYLFPSADGEARIHDIVWGLFCFGGSYGGGFLRMSPATAGHGVINSARGAVEGLIFEV